MLKTKVKAGNITNLSDARYCAGMGVDWLGFPSSSVDPKTFAEITDWVSGPQFVLELDEQSVQELVDYPIEFIQINSTQIDTFQSFPNSRFIIKIDLPAWGTAKEVIKDKKQQIQFLLVTNLSGNWANDKEVLDAMTNQAEVYIDLEACPYSLPEILDFGVAGINIAGNQELKPGLKDYSDLAEVLEQLEVE
jgi:phosphoribosylanthranilate isomerase